MHKGRRRNDVRRSEAALLQCILFAGFLILQAAFFVKADTAYAAAAVAKFNLVEGRVDVMKEGELPAVPANAGGQLFNKDIIRTRSASRAEIDFVDGTVLKVGQRSRIDISEYAAEEAKGTRTIGLRRGKVEAIVPKPGKQTEAASRVSRFQINTPNAVAGVRGTDYIVLVENDITLIYVKEGTVTVVNPMFPDIVITVNAGELCTVRFNEPPTKREATEEEKQYLELALLLVDGGYAFEGSGSYFSSEITGTGLSSLPPLYLTPPLPLPPPAVEVGRTTLSGSLVAGPSGQFDFISVVLKDVIFLAPSTGQPPALWNTDSISGSFRFGPNISDGVSSIPVSDGKGISGNVNINQWGNNTWSGSTNGQGRLSGGSYSGPVSFGGSISGTHGGGSSGSFTGAGSGTASK